MQMLSSSGVFEGEPSGDLSEQLALWSPSSKDMCWGHGCSRVQIQGSRSRAVAEGTLRTHVVLCEE